MLGPISQSPIGLELEIYSQSDYWIDYMDFICISILGFKSSPLVSEYVVPFQS